MKIIREDLERYVEKIKIWLVIVRNGGGGKVDLK